MLKELYGTSMLKYENKEEILEYYILSNNDENVVDMNKMQIYGIEIVKKSDSSEEKSFVSDLTVNKEFVEEIAKKFKDNIVTPIHLYDVLEDILWCTRFFKSVKIPIKNYSYKNPIIKTLLNCE